MLLSAVFTTILIFGTACSGPDAAQDRPWSGSQIQELPGRTGQEESVNRHFREVAERVRKEGTIPVIVRLQAMAGAESLRQSQSALLDELTGYDPAMTKQFRHLPTWR
jgi:hypothetical protein